MGLFSSLRRASKRLVKQAAPVALGAGVGFATGGPAGAARGGLLTLAGGGRSAMVPTALRPTALAPAASRLPGPAGTLLPGLFGIQPRTRLPVGPEAASFGCPAGFHPAKDRSGRCVRNRRMNPMNPRAARRAIRRIKGAMKMLRRIERQLPKQRVRRAPAGHRARLTHQ